MSYICRSIVSGTKAMGRDSGPDPWAGTGPPGRLHSGHPGIQLRAGVTAQRQALRPDGLHGRVHPGLPARGAGGRGRLAGLRDVQPLGRRRPSSAGHADDVGVHVRACRRCYALAGLSQATVYNTGTMEHSPGRRGSGGHPRLRCADQRLHGHSLGTNDRGLRVQAMDSDRPLQPGRPALLRLPRRQQHHLLRAARAGAGQGRRESEEGAALGKA